MDDQYSYSDRMESEPTKTKRQRKFNREFQKNEVIRFLVRKEALDFIAEPLILGELFEEGEVEGYSAYLYKAKDDREYDEGFGPSILVKLGTEETVWKRSRNKWNPFEKIRTIANPNETDFAVVWDRNKLNSYYVTERMYYYLDKEKHREKYTDVRAKLYITRLHQKGDRIFLLQFIGERLSEEEQESQKRMQKQKEEKKARQIEQKKKDKFKEATSFTSSGVGSTPAGTNGPSIGGFDINRLISPYQQPIAPANVRGTYPPWPLNNPGKHEFEIKVPTPIKAQNQGPTPAGQQLPNFSQFTSTVDQVAQMQQQQMVQQFQHQLHLSQPYQLPNSYSQSTSPGSSAMYPPFNPSPPFLMPQPSATPQLPPITTTPFNMMGNSTQFRPPSWPTYGVVTTPAGSFLSPYQVPGPQNSLKRRSADIDSPRSRDTATPTDLSSPSSPGTYDYEAPPLKRRSIEPPQEHRRPASWSSPSTTTTSAPSYFPNLPPLASTSSAMQIDSSSNPTMHHLPSMPVQFPQGFVFKPEQFSQYQHQQ